MSKLLKYVVVIALILIAVFAILKFTNKGKSEEVVDKEEVPKKVFEEPQYMIYTVNDKEKYKLTKEDREYSEILDKLNSSIDENYNTKREKLLLSILDIHKEIYSKKSVLRLIYSEAYEIDIVFEKNSVLDIIYIEDGRTSCFSRFDNKVQDEIKEYLDNK